MASKPPRTTVQPATCQSSVSPSTEASLAELDQEGAGHGHGEDGRAHLVGAVMPPGRHRFPLLAERR